MDLSFSLEKTVPGASLGVWDECVGMKKNHTEIQMGIRYLRKDVKWAAGHTRWTHKLSH